MSLPVPLLITEAFGKNAPNPADITLPIPIPDQTGTVANQASFDTGFPPKTFTPIASGGLPPLGQDVNGILWMVTAHLACISAGQPYVYNATQSGLIGGYPLGALLARSDLTGFWFNTVANNVTDPDGGSPAGWVPAFNFGDTDVAVTTADVTVNNDDASKTLIICSGTLTGNRNVILPNWVASQWIVVNNCTGAFTLTVKTAAGTGVVVPATGPSTPTSIYCDDAGNIQTTGVSTAGLAPINSPTFTGTPAAPTATPATASTTQIATLAFVQNAIAAALTGYAQLASPTFSGTPTVPTAPPGTNSAQIASTAFVEAAISLGSSFLSTGYYKAAGGLIIQWGLSQSGTGLGAVSVTFPIPFPNAALSAVASTANRTSGTSAGSGFVANLTAIGMTIWVDQSNVSVRGGYWIALGH